MLMEVYYRHYRENCQEKNWEMEEKSMPYMILFPSVSKMHDFMLELQRDGLQCVASNHSYRGLLVNLDLNVRRHIVGGTYRTLISVQNPLRLCRTGICRSLSAG